MKVQMPAGQWQSEYIKHFALLRTWASAHLSALLDLLPALAQPGQIHLALAARVALLEFWDAHARHIICLSEYPDLGLLHSKTCVCISSFTSSMRGSTTR